MEKTGKNKGITLVALVITIIILLILAGIAISAIAGQEGLFSKTQIAKKQTEIASEKEGISLAVTSAKISDNGYGSIEKENLQDAINKQFGKDKAIVEDNGDQTYTVTMKNTEERKYTVEEDGTIVEGKYDKWDGTEVTEPTEKTENEIHIYKASELKWLADQVNNEGNLFEGYTIYLENNIDLGAREENGNWETEANEALKWIAIGKEQAKMLKAIFDGKNHIIKGVYVNDTEMVNGIFGWSNSILNLTVKNSYIKGAAGTAGIVGILWEGTIDNCHNVNTTVIGISGYTFGGIVGQAGGDISNCSNTGKIVGSKRSSDEYSQTGGIVGYLLKSLTISNCYNSGSVNGEGGYNVGGIVGVIEESAQITQCYNEGEVISKHKQVGGIAGTIREKSQVSNCYNLGTITGNGGFAGGIVGVSFEASQISACYNKGEITGDRYFVGGIAGKAETSSQIINCYNEGKIKGNNVCIGGIVGYAYNSSQVSNSYNTGVITGNERVGGIVGEADPSSQVSDCYNTGEVTGNSMIAGIVGIAANIVTRCYNTGAITGNDRVAGIVGDNITAIPQNISLCYNTGTVKGSEKVGGISGELGAQGYAGTETKCYNKGQIIYTGTEKDYGEIAGNMANDATVTKSYYLANDENNYGVGTINEGGNIEEQRKGAQKTEVDLKTFEEFLSWIEQQ